MAPWQHLGLQWRRTPAMARPEDGCLGMCPAAAWVSIVCVLCRSGCTLRCVLDLSNADSAPPRLHSSRTSSSLLVLVLFLLLLLFSLNFLSFSSLHSLSLFFSFLSFCGSSWSLPVRASFFAPSPSATPPLLPLPPPSVSPSSPNPIPAVFSGRLEFGLVSLRGVSIYYWND